MICPAKKTGKSPEKKSSIKKQGFFDGHQGTVYSFMQRSRDSSVLFS
jgi:hypothetical protein